MAQQQPTSSAAAASILPQSSFAGIESALTSIIENNPSQNADIIGTASALSTITMDRIETMMQKLRGRGRRLKQTRPLAFDGHFAHAPASPQPKTARGFSPAPRTGRGISPAPKTGRAISPAPRTGRGVSPATRTALAKSPFSGREKKNLPRDVSARTGRSPSPNSEKRSTKLAPRTPDASAKTQSQKSSGYPTAISPGMKSDIPPILLTGYEASPPASRRQSISNAATTQNPVAGAPLKTGREVSPSHRIIYGQPATPPSPASRRQSISNVVAAPNPPSSGAPLKTGREVSPRTGRSPSYPAVSPLRQTGSAKSPKPRTALPRSPLVSVWFDLRSATRPFLNDASTRTGRSSSQKSARQPSTAKSPIKPPSRNAGASTRTGRSPSQKSSGYPTAISPGMKSDIPPILLTGYEASPPSSQRQSAASPAPKSDRPQMFLTGREVSPSNSSHHLGQPATPPPPASRRQSISNAATRTARGVSPSPGSQTNIAKKPMTPAEQWANVKPGSGPKICPAKSPSVATGREADSSRSAKANKPQVNPDQVWNDLLKAAEKDKIATKVCSPGLAKRPIDTPSTRTGLAKSPQSVTGQSPSQRSSGYPTAISPGRSLESFRLPSTVTCVSPCPQSSGYPTAISPGPHTAISPACRQPPRDTSIRTGRSSSQRSSGYPTAVCPSNESLKTNELFPPLDPNFVRDGQAVAVYPAGMPPATPPAPASRRQSISHAGTFSVSPKSNRPQIFLTGREVSPSRSPYNFGQQLATPPPPASRRQSISNAATRTARGVSPANVGAKKSMTDVATAVEGDSAEQPPSVLLFVHSFYVFSMTLDAWASQFGGPNNNSNGGSGQQQ